MSDFLASGLTWLAGELQANCSQLVVYQRGADQITGLAAVLGKTTFRIADGLNERIEHSDADFIVRLSSLVLNSNPILPVRGDVIVYTPLGGVAQKYQVKAPGNERPYKIDPYGLEIRIHTMLLGPA